MTTISKPVRYLAILGPSGGGKGTQAALLAKHFRYRHLSIGAILRQEIAQKTANGQKLARYVNRGLLAPDELVAAILFRQLRPAVKSGFILDGFPRTFAQAELLDDFLASLKIRLELVILLEVPDEVIVERRRRAIAAGRQFQPGRADDHEEVLRRRLKEYHQNIQPIKDFYRRQGILVVVDGNRPIAAIQADLRQLIENGR